MMEKTARLILGGTFAFALLFAGALAVPALAQNSLGGGAQQSDDYSGKGTDRPASPDSTTTTTSEAPQTPSTFGEFGGNTGDLHGLSGEGVANFESDTTIGPDGTLHVRETITVNSTGDEIRHGIFRDFPTDYRDRHGIRRRTTFDVESITRDGHDEPYEMYSISNGKEAKIGSADVIVDPGVHTYVITYTTKRQIGFFENFDELYWNATGNGWKLRIAHATATIHLPAGAAVVQTSFYTGEQGESGKDATEQRIDDHTLRWETTRQLGLGEGLTVAVAFTKGVIPPPSSADEAGNYLMDNASTGVALIGLIVLALYFGIAWYKFGRDPARGTIVPLFAPPKDFSASATRFVHRMGYDRKAFAAALIAMATKGYLTIKEESHVYTLKRTGKSENDAGLATAERAVAKALFDGPDDEIELKQSNHTDVQAAISGLQKALRNEDEGVYFVSNRGWFGGGVAILIVSAILAAVLADDASGVTPVLFFVGFWGIGTSLLVFKAYQSWQGINGPGWKIVNIVGAVISTVFATVFVGGLLLALFVIPEVAELNVSTLTVLALAIQGVLAFVFYRLLKAPTVAGQKVRDQIDGFKMFLETTEKDRLEVLHPPQVTPEVFEKFLPYAIALDCENQWSKKFEADAAAAGMGAQQTAYTPGWYYGPSYSRLGTTGFVSAVGSAIGSAAASAATAPGSSSGSGGGGFSGGGGGGGGGGGW